MCVTRHTTTSLCACSCCSCLSVFFFWLCVGCEYRILYAYYIYLYRLRLFHRPSSALSSALLLRCCFCCPHTIEHIKCVFMFDTLVHICRRLRAAVELGFMRLSVRVRAYFGEYGSRSVCTDAVGCQLYGLCICCGFYGVCILHIPYIAHYGYCFEFKFMTVKNEPNITFRREKNDTSTDTMEAPSD